LGEKIKDRRKEGTPDLPLLGELITEYSSLPMAAVEGGGYVLRYVNPAFCRLVGKKREEMVGNPFVQAVPDGEGCLPVFEHVYQTGERAECESRWSYAIWPIPGAGGSHAGVMVLATDKTEDAMFRQKAAEMNQELLLSVVRQHELAEEMEKLTAQLQLEITERKRVERVIQARLRLSLTADAMSLDGVLQGTLDEIEALTQSTIGFYHFLEADQETLSLQNWSTNTLDKMCTAEGKGSHYPVSKAGVWADCIRERRPVIHNDYASLAHRKDMPPGHAPVIREMVIPIISKGLIVAVIGVGNKPADYNEADIDLALLLGDFSWEIVERKRAKEMLDAQKADFYAMVTHDVKSPLTSVLGYSELMMSRADKYDADTNEMIAAIMRSGERINHLIENFLSISKMESASIVLNPAPTDIAALLRDACSEIEREVNKKKLHLKVEIADGLPEATVDSKVIERAVLNLLHNAVNYTPAPGTITLKAGLHGKDFIIISVTDTGKGIPPGEQKAIFEKYYRSKKTARTKGSGLGLAIVKAAAEAHGGRVEVESEAGQGSTFRLFIPVNLPRP
jgi:signal transduction histidine kinase